jgi:hypothetical protein
VSISVYSGCYVFYAYICRTWQIVPKQDHLVCFLGGSFILGVTEGGRKEVKWDKLDERDMEDFVVGKGIIESCMKTHETAT